MGRRKTTEMVEDIIEGVGEGITQIPGWVKKDKTTEKKKDLNYYINLAKTIVLSIAGLAFLIIFIKVIYTGLT